SALRKCHVASARVARERASTSNVRAGARLAPRDRGSTRLSTVMQFREFAAAETSALLRRLMTSRAEHSKRELQAVRRAFETAMRTVEDKLGAAAPADDAISALVEKLAAAATAEIENAAKRTRAEGQAALDAAVEAARAEHADALKAEQQKSAAARQELKEASAAQAFADAARREAEAAREHEAAGRA